MSRAATERLPKDFTYTLTERARTEAPRTSGSISATAAPRWRNRFGLGVCGDSAS